MTTTILRTPRTQASAFCQTDTCETIDTHRPQPVQQRRPVRLARERLPAATTFWCWLLGETAASSPVVSAAARRPHAAH